jgi:hypothetical protein
MKKICALICAVLMLASLAGCSLPGMSMEDLCGNWESLTYFDAQDTQEILEGLDFYPEEIALADLNGLCIVATVEFKTDKQYNYGYDVDATRAMAEQYFSDFLDTLYENREDLVETYGETILSMSKDAFLTAYAELFGMTSGQELIEVLAENALDYEALAESTEFGTFRLRLNDIYMKEAGASTEEYVTFKIENDTLTLIYQDGEEVYTRR